MAEIPFEPYTGQGKLRFWCQKVLPLVYDESLSYYELLNKVVDYLNNTISDVSACEDNITALRDAFVQLQDYVNEQLEDFAPEVERIIDEMVDSGEFGEILTDVVNGLIAGEYSTTQGYAQFDYVLKDGKLYCATASTSGEWDSTKWRETTVGADMQLLNQRVYNLNAGQVAYNNNATYSSNTVGYKINNLNNAGEDTLDDCNNFILGIKKVGPSTLNMPESAYGFIESYIAQNDQWKWQFLTTTQTPQKIFKRANINNTGWTEWVRIADNTDIDNLNAGDIEYLYSDTYNNSTVGKELQELKGSLNAVCLRAAVKTISGNGTSSNTLTGLTADHVVGNWGMFSDSACTTPIPENSPTCDITITTAANAWSVTIANFSSTFYLRPTFILKQN